MNQRLAHLALVIPDYDEAIRYYTETWGFELIEDTPMGEDKRWVLVSPRGQGECCLLLAKAANEEQRASIGNQTGGRVFLFLFTDDFNRDYEHLKENKVKIIREAEQATHGMVAVFEDCYGNKWDLIQPSEQNTWHKNRQSKK